MTAQARPDELIRILRAEFVTKSGGVPGAACVIFACGATGWRATGGTIARTLVHEVAFQLDTGGNARGAYAVDLQQQRFAVTNVAAGDFSAILSGEDNEIHPNSDYCTIVGDTNILSTSGGNEPSYCWVEGYLNDLSGICYGLTVLGVGHVLVDAIYGTYLGDSQQTDGASSCFAFIEGNDLLIAGTDAPTYCATGGVLNLMEGDLYGCFQWGESNEMVNAGGVNAGNWMGAQFGYNNFQTNVDHNFAFGRRTGSYLPTDAGYFDGRCLYNGDDPQEFPGGSEDSGFNQSSRFDQNMKVLNWLVAWTTGRFEFPIIQDSVWAFRARIAGTEQGCANSYDWEIVGMIENDGGVTTMLHSTVTNHYRDVATKEWQAVADNVNDRLAFQYRDTAGPDGTDCNIQFSMQTTEVGWD